MATSLRLSRGADMADPDTSALLTLVLLMAVEVIGIAILGLMTGETK
jgi:hypothetical protein